VSSPTGSYLNKRVLKINVGFLLSEGPGNARQMPFDVPSQVKVEDDLFLAWLKGDLTLTRTKEGILVQGDLLVAHKRECDRCLDEFLHEFTIEIEELYAYPPDLSSAVFSVDSTGYLDLAPLLREEVLIEESYRVFCREGCNGINTRGTKVTPEDVSEDLIEEEANSIDPRLAILKQLLDEKD
jgi:uncharacterized protein